MITDLKHIFAQPSEAKDEDFRSTAKPVAGSVSTRPKRGKQRRNFSDLLHDESDDDSSDVSDLLCCCVVLKN